MSGCLMDCKECKMLYGGCGQLTPDEFYGKSPIFELASATTTYVETIHNITIFDDYMETTGYNGVTEVIDDEYFKTIPYGFVEPEPIPDFPRILYPLKQQFKPRGFKANTRFN